MRGSDPYRRLGDGITAARSPDTLHHPRDGAIQCSRNTTYLSHLWKEVCRYQARFRLETYPCFVVGTLRPAPVLYSGAGLARGYDFSPMHELQYVHHVIGDNNGFGREHHWKVVA